MKSKTYGKKRNKKSKRRENTKKKHNKKKMFGGIGNSLEFNDMFINFLKEHDSSCCLIPHLALSKTYYRVNTENIQNCVNEVFKCKTNATSILIPLLIPGHANLLIIRPRFYVVEWFEPHGSNYQGSESETKIIQNLVQQSVNDFVDQLNNKYQSSFKSSEFNSITLRKFKLVSPDVLCPLDGVQKIDNYCMLWMFYVLIEIIKNPYDDTSEIIDYLIKLPYNERIANIKLINDNYDIWIKNHQNIGNIKNNKNSIHQLFGVREMMENGTLVKNLKPETFTNKDFDEEDKKFKEWQAAKKLKIPN